MFNILIVYWYEQYPPRTAIWDHLYSFQRYSGCRCFYVNLAVRTIPWYIRKVRFDLIVFHTIFLSARWLPPLFEKLVRRARVLKQSDAVRVALPQDEFLNTDVLSDFINEFGVGHVFSVAPESEWPKIYSRVDFGKVKFFKVLTGYLDNTTVARIRGLAKTMPSRTIDIGYRAWRAAPWLGRHGFLKTQIAEVFAEGARREGLVADISTHERDTFLGDDWYKFLLRCKYTIGVEGGASILDHDGTVMRRTNEYVALHPGASWDEIEENCFPNRDGFLRLFAISPRHLEACATKTCQVLVEGNYNGVLVAGEHYIEIKRDFSNVDEVLTALKMDDQREAIAERAYRDIVESGAYDYHSFVRLVIGQCLAQRKPVVQQTGWQRLAWNWNRLADTLSWLQLALRRLFIVAPKRKVRRILVSILGEEAFLNLHRRLLYGRMQRS